MNEPGRLHAQRRLWKLRDQAMAGWARRRGRARCTSSRTEVRDAGRPGVRHGRGLYGADHDRSLGPDGRVDRGARGVRCAGRAWAGPWPDDAGGRAEDRTHRRDDHVRHSLFRPDDRRWPVRPHRAAPAGRHAGRSGTGGDGNGGLGGPGLARWRRLDDLHGQCGCPAAALCTDGAQPPDHGLPDHALQRRDEPDALGWADGTGGGGPAVGSRRDFPADDPGHGRSDRLAVAAGVDLRAGRTSPVGRHHAGAARTRHRVHRLHTRRRADRG